MNVCDITVMDVDIIQNMLTSGARMLPQSFEACLLHEDGVSDLHRS